MWSLTNSGDAAMARKLLMLATSLTPSSVLTKNYAYSLPLFGIECSEVSSMALLWQSYATFMALHGSSMALHGSSMTLLWRFYGTSFIINP